MSNSNPNHSIETSIALLGLKIDANQSELNVKLDGMISLNNEQLLHMSQNFENHRHQNEQKFISMEKNHDYLEERVTNIEKHSAKNDGGKLTLYTILGGTLTAIVTWIATHINFFGQIGK